MSLTESIGTEAEDIQFDKIPITALRKKGRLILSQSLNKTKIIPSDAGLPRDWRGIADLAGLRSVHGQTIQMYIEDPMQKLLQIWCSKDNNQTATIDNLIKFLVEIDRWDVLNDINDTLVEDATFYKCNKNDEKPAKYIEVIKNKSDDNILTVDDVYNARQNLPLQHYDAFILFDESDEDFAAELIEKMEYQGFKFCFKERDLIGGVSFEHEAVMRLISERCNRLIVIYSPEFLKSSANTYLLNYAHSLVIKNGERKILPCLYKYCELPPTLSCMWHLDYNRTGKFINFWDKLRDSIQTTSPIETKNQKVSRRTELKSKTLLENCTTICNDNKTKLESSRPQANQSNPKEEIDGFVEVNNSEITKSYNEEIDIQGYTPLINEKNPNIASTSKKSTKKWNFKKWLPSRNKLSKEKSNEKDKSKGFKRQKLVSV